MDPKDKDIEDKALRLLAEIQRLSEEAERVSYELRQVSRRGAAGKQESDELQARAEAVIARIKEAREMLRNPEGKPTDDQQQGDQE
jgi:uncharacterized coiled-coil DUF342 family protein